MLRLSVIATILVLLSLLLFSFTSEKISNDFLSLLGISKQHANEKITASMLGGYLDQYGLSNAKNIAPGNRAAVVKDLVSYSKEFINSPAFIDAYKAKRNNAKPVQPKVETPEEMQKNMIASYRKSVTETEESIKKADESVKKYLQTALDASKKALKEAEDPNNQYIAAYRENYEQMLEAGNAAYQQQLSQWEEAYPGNHLLYVKERLQIFMNETADIDFNAALTERNGKKYFVNSAYEHKSNRWKMAFRAGKEAIETARNLVQQWIDGIK